jgi:hypothetical protein
MKTIMISVAKSANMGENTSHHFVRFCNPELSICPQLGVGGGSPNPKKSRATRDVIPATTANGKFVMMGTKEFGRICLNMIFQVGTPIDIAAAT